MSGWSWAWLPVTAVRAGPLAYSDAVGSVLYRDAALADGRSARLRVGGSLLAEDGRVRWIRPSGEEGQRPPGCEVVDAGGTTIIPGLVDGHSHLTLPGGSHWIERGADPTETLVAVAESNGELQYRSGVLWARDVGSPRRVHDDGERAVSIGVRDRWRGRRDRPYVRAAGTWITVAGVLPAGLSVEAHDGDELLAAAAGQLDDGADFVKLYLDGPDKDTAPWTAAEVGRVAGAVHAGGGKGDRPCHVAGRRAGMRRGGRGFDRARFRARRRRHAADGRPRCRAGHHDTVLKSWLTFSTTTAIPRFAGPDSRVKILDRLEQARHSVRLAHAAGVAIVGGTDFGGGSARANQLPWEVECLVEAGLEPWEALAAVIWRGGDLLGEPEAGVIREGGPADFSLVHGDPLTDPTALWRIWRVA